MSALAMKPSVLHGAFTIERRFRAPPAKVFAAFTIEEQKRQWFGCDPEFEMQVMSLDFRVGGIEMNRTGLRGGTVHAMDGVYLDIVPNQRFVMSMVMHLDARKISVSLLTVEFLPDGAGTLLLFTEQYAFLDGYAEVADREEGSKCWAGHAGKISRRSCVTYRLHLHYLSSYCWKTTIAFYEAGVPFEAVEVNLGDPAGRAELQRISPLVKIPALEDRARGAVVNETSVIIEYLAIHEPSARQLVPADAKAALPVRYYDRFFDNYVQGPMNRVVANEIRPPDAQRDPFGVEQARAELIRSYDVLEAKLPRQGFATGDAFTLADCAACPALFYADYVAPYEATHPNLWAYFKRLEARPSFARALKEKEPVFHYFPLANKK